MKLLTRSAEDLTLCCRYMGTLQRIFQYRHDLRASLLDAGLLDALTSVLARVTAEEAAAAASDERVTPPDGSREASYDGGEGGRGGPWPEDPSVFAALTADDVARAVEAFCHDIAALHICGFLLRGRENARGLTLLRDVLDVIEVSSMPARNKVHLQRVVLQIALDRVLVDARGSDGAGQDLDRTMVAASSVCRLAVDFIVFSSAAATDADATDADATDGGSGRGTEASDFAFVCHVFHVSKGLLAPSVRDETKSTPTLEITDNMGRLCLHLLAATQPVSRGGFLVHNLATTPELIHLLCTHADPDYNFYTGARIFLAVYEFFQRVLQTTRHLEAEAGFSDVATATATASPSAARRSAQLGDNQLQTLSANAEAIMREIVKRHRRLINSIVDVDGSTLGTGGHWHVTFYGSIDIDKGHWNLESGREHQRWAQQRRLFHDTHRAGLEALGAATERDVQRVMSAGIERRNKQKHKGIMKIRSDKAQVAHSQTLWKKLVARVTHPRAPWAGDAPAPSVWVLDPIAGPHGARGRLKPSQVRLNPIAPTRSGVKAHEPSEGSPTSGVEPHAHTRPRLAPDASIPLPGLSDDGGASFELSSDDEEMPSSEAAAHDRRRSSGVGVVRRFKQLWRFVDYYLRLYLHPGLAALSWRDRAKACRIVIGSAEEGMLDLPENAPYPVGRLAREQPVTRQMPDLIACSRFLASRAR